MPTDPLATDIKNAAGTIAGDVSADATSALKTAQADGNAISLAAHATAVAALTDTRNAVAKIQGSGIIKSDLMLAKAKLLEALAWFEKHFSMHTPAQAAPVPPATAPVTPSTQVTAPPPINA